MFRRLHAWWDAPLFSMPHRANERQVPMFTDVDCPPNMMYMINRNTMIGPPSNEQFAGWF